MKLPGVWITAAFAAGIALANALPRNSCGAVWIAAVVALILAGVALAWRNLPAIAWACALTAWCALGGVAVDLERASVPANHVTRLIAANRLDTSEPLRWHGRLREDPMALPWGHRYEIDLEDVGIRGVDMPVSGGLRADLYKNERYLYDADADGSRGEDGAPVGLRAGDRVEALMRARPPRNFLDPGAFDIHGYLALQKIDLAGSLRSGALLHLVDHPRPTLLHRLARLRGNLLARLDALFADHPDRAAVLRAMLLGDKSFVDSETVADFQKTSAYHILVVAGLHVGALVAFLFWICRRLRLRMESSSLVALASLAAYVGVVQDRPPILRAALMAAFYLLARPLFRRIDLLNTVALAAIALLFWRPSSLADSSFQLSFAAAGVIAGLALPWIDRSSAPYHAGLKHLWDVTRDGAHAPRVVQFRIELRAAIRWLSSRVPGKIAHSMGTFVTIPLRAGLRLWEIMLLSAVIQWGMLPLLASDFHRISLQGPVSNIPAVLLTGMIVPLGFLMLAASFLWSRIGFALAKLVSFGAGWLLACVKLFASVPHTSYRIPGPPLWLAVAFAGAFVALGIAARATPDARRLNRSARQRPTAPIAFAEWFSLAVLIVPTVLIATYPFAPVLAHGKLEVNILDVGQGDSSFIAFPDGSTLLVDGGGLSGSGSVRGYRSGFDVGENVVSPYLWSRGIQHIDAIAITHGDHDHMDGLRSVMENFDVGELWIGRDDTRPAVDSLLQEARKRGIHVAHKLRGDQFDWGAEGEFLNPVQSAAAARPANDDSLVLRLTDGSRHFLLTGDIQARAEREISTGDSAIASDFLKVPHHGSKTSSTEHFLAVVVPRVAVVSVGSENPFGHPNDAVMERYQHDGIQVLRTDRYGAVTAQTDGRDLQVFTFTDGMMRWDGAPSSPGPAKVSSGH